VSLPQGIAEKSPVAAEMRSPWSSRLIVRGEFAKNNGGCRRRLVSASVEARLTVNPDKSYVQLARVTYS
jgi:hypothetical protein